MWRVQRAGQDLQDPLVKTAVQDGLAHLVSPVCPEWMEERGREDLRAPKVGQRPFCVFSLILLNNKCLDRCFHWFDCKCWNVVWTFCKKKSILNLPGEKGGKGEKGEPGIGERGEPGPVGPIGNHWSFTYCHNYSVQDEEVFLKLLLLKHCLFLNICWEFPMIMCSFL